MMTLRHFMMFALTFGALVREAGDAWAQGVRVMESAPAANATINGQSTAFSVRFDKPVDHVRSEGAGASRPEGIRNIAAAAAVRTASVVCTSANLAAG